MDKEKMVRRATELRELAETRNISFEADLADLPQGDPVAEIGLLASKLNMDFGLAFDTSLDVQKGI